MSRFATLVLPFLVTLGVIALLLQVSGIPPEQVFQTLLMGVLGSANRIADTIILWVALYITACGLTVTFAANRWNLGAEGQIIMGAIAATAVSRNVVGLPGASEILLILLGGILGGAIWGCLLAALSLHGKVSEILVGLGLNFTSVALVLYVIFGPWKQPSGGTMSGTVLLPENLWLPTFIGLRLSPVSVVLAIWTGVVVYFLLRKTRWGLQLKATGGNPRSAYLLGISTNTLLIQAFALSGGLAGLCGAIQVIGVNHRLIASVSGGYGFLAILISLLPSHHPLWIAPVALFFAAISIGSTQLQLEHGLDGSLGGVMLGTLVLVYLVTRQLSSIVHIRTKGAQ